MSERPVVLSDLSPLGRPRPTLRARLHRLVWVATMVAVAGAVAAALAIGLARWWS